MLNKNDIKILLSKMTDDTYSNIKKISETFGNLHYKDEDNQSLLHILVDDKYDETKCFLAIKSLLQIGLSPNLEDDFNYNFIQTALYAGYSENFILNIIGESLKYELNINHVDSDKDTIMHTAIYSDDYLGEIENIFDLLYACGFDSSLKDNNGRNLLEAMIFQGQYTNEQEEKFRKKFKERTIKSEKYEQSIEGKSVSIIKQEVPVVISTKSLSDKDILELEKYGRVLNNKNYVVSPTIGREKELKNLMVTLAQDKKSPLIVGPSGVGKTSIVDELAYRIKTQQVPSFLQDKIILEVNPSDVVAGCQYVGMFEENMTKLMKLCEKLDVIVFIDEIHTIYGIGSVKGKDNDMADMLKHYIDRTNLKVIGTTTKTNYDEYFSSNDLKRRFERVNVKEPIEDILYQIIDKVIGDYCLKNEIYFENENIRKEIINIIMSATEKKHRVYDDMTNNPDLSISIIDKSFAFAKVYDSEFISQEHFIESFTYCDRLYKSAREQAISKLKNININIFKPVQKVLKIDFKK